MEAFSESDDLAIGEIQEGAKRPLLGRGAIYARYSSDNQDESSIEQQVYICREQAADDGVVIPDELVFYDEAISGSDPNRPQFHALMNAAEQRAFDTLYVENLSRLSRQALFSLSTLEDLRYLGIKVVSVSESFDSSRPGAELEGSLRAIVHDEQRKTISSNVRRGLQDAARKGYSTGVRCFGYRSEPIPGSEFGRRGQPKCRYRPSIDQSEAAIVRDVFQWYGVDHWSISKIVKTLNKRGIRGRTFTADGAWRHDTVIRLLRNRKYIGEWSFGLTMRERHKRTGKVRQLQRERSDRNVFTRRDESLRIVSDEAFDAAQKRLAESNAKVAKCRRKKGQLGGSMRDSASPKHMLQGILRCGKCGELLYTSGPKYMRCSAHLKGMCDQKTGVIRKDVQSLILAKIQEQMSQNVAWREAILDCALATIAEMQRNRPDQLVALRRKKQSLEAAIERLTDQCETATKGVSAKLHERLEQRNRELESVERELHRLMELEEQRAKLPTRAELEKRLDEWPQLLSASDPATAIAIRNLIGTITVEEVRTEGSKRPAIVLRFKVSLKNAIQVMSPELSGDIVNSSNHDQVIEILLRKIPLHEKLADEVHQLYEAGWMRNTIGERLGCNRNLVKRALNFWRSQNGLPPLDARRERKRLPSQRLAVKLSDQAKELWDQGLFMKDIAKRLGCDRGIATQAVAYWFTSRNLPVPNNQKRRKDLKLGRAKNGQK